MNENQKVELEVELEEFGVVSEDTHGAVFGHTYDGAHGFRLP